jgi:hypothetical protein
LTLRLPFLYHFLDGLALVHSGLPSHDLPAATATAAAAAEAAAAANSYTKYFPKQLRCRLDLKMTFTKAKLHPIFEKEKGIRGKKRHMEIL